MHVKKNDMVVVITPKGDKTPRKVLAVFPKSQQVLVEGANMKMKNVKRRRQEQKSQQVEREFPIHVSNVKLADKNQA